MQKDSKVWCICTQLAFKNTDYARVHEKYVNFKNNSWSSGSSHRKADTHVRTFFYGACKWMYLNSLIYTNTVRSFDIYSACSV